MTLRGLAMPPSRKEFSRQELENLYCDRGMTEDDIGDLFGCSGRTIGRRLKELGIPIRSVGPVSSVTVPLEHLRHWSPQLAYAVGLIAADGNLNKDRVRVEFISTDYELVELYCRALCIENAHVVFTRQHSRKSWYQVKLDDRSFREFLEALGLTPAKSKTLRALQIPDDMFPDFLRGLLDGDGSWYLSRSWLGRYTYLRVEVCSASRSFIRWIAETVERLNGLVGYLRARPFGRSYDLTFIGQKALALGNWVYYSPTVLALSRKRRVYESMKTREN